MGRRQAVSHWILIPAFPGSNPGAPTKIHKVSVMWKILNKIDAQSLLDAQAALNRSLAQPENEFTRNSSIQCFEFTLELVWKTLKRVLVIYGETTSTARDTFRSAQKIKIIDAPESWFSYLELRNKSSHTYAEPVAKEIYSALPAFSKDVERVIEKLKALQP